MGGLYFVALVTEVRPRSANLLVTVSTSCNIYTYHGNQRMGRQADTLVSRARFTLVSLRRRLCCQVGVARLGLPATLRMTMQGVSQVLLYPRVRGLRQDRVAGRALHLGCEGEQERLAPKYGQWDDGNPPGQG
jgi:hypothetical protein